MAISSFPSSVQCQNSGQQSCHGSDKILAKSIILVILQLYLNNSNCITLDIGAGERTASDNFSCNHRGRHYRGDVVVEILQRRHSAMRLCSIDRWQHGGRNCHSMRHCAAVRCHCHRGRHCRQKSWGRAFQCCEMAMLQGDTQHSRRHCAVFCHCCRGRCYRHFCRGEISMTAHPSTTLRLLF